MMAAPKVTAILLTGPKTFHVIVSEFIHFVETIIDYLSSYENFLYMSFRCPTLITSISKTLSSTE